MKVVIGTRGSALALTQTNFVKERLETAYPDHQFELMIIKTKGDQNQHTPLHEMGGSGVFVKNIEEYLQAGTIDLAVHSMKDMPSLLPEGLCLCEAWVGEDARDVLVRNPHRLDKGIHLVATGSIRRQVLLKEENANIQTVGIRGNVDRRLQKMEEQAYDGLILAAAGLHRLHKQDIITKYFDPTSFIPACTQGVLALEIREDEKELKAMIEQFSDPDTQVRVCSERAFLATLGGSCQLPTGAYLDVKGDDICLYGMLGKEDGTYLVKDHKSGKRADAYTIGVTLAKELLEMVNTHHG